ncbi:MAG: hypothetical protein DME21_10335 [Verrucomicrobia bacterium]|nr:MAG: hypothetical protein DME21_10335 [Verrucomicrobiota bacterium]
MICAIESGRSRNRLARFRDHPVFATFAALQILGGIASAPGRMKSNINVVHFRRMNRPVDSVIYPATVVQDCEFALRDLKTGPAIPGASGPGIR